MKKILLGIIILLCVALAIVIIIVQIKKGSEEIKIGAILPLTGESAFYGESIMKGIDTAVHEINEEGGINAKKIKIIYEDSKALPADGVSALNKLINIHRVRIVIGDAVSSVTLAIAPIAEDNKVLVLSPLSSAPEITDAGDFIFRNVPSDLFGGKVAAHFAVKDQRWNSLAILFINNDFGVGLTKVFTSEVNILGGKIAVTEAYEQGSADFRTQLTKIKSANPDAIFLVGYREAPQILIQAKELGVRAKFLGTGLLEDPKVIDIAKEAAEGIFFTQLQYTPDLPDSETRSFVEKFRNKYNSDPNIITAYGYDAMKVLAFAIMKSNLVPENIKKELYGIKKFKGVTGEISFDENGDVIQPMGVKTIEKGEFIWYKRKVSIE